MFNYKSKLGNTQLDRNITTHQLIKLIKDNPQKEIISQIRNKRSSDDNTYKALKGKLPVFAPNALFNNNLNQSNFISGTGYFYLDIDDCENYGSAYELKESFLQKYSDKVYLCWTSVSLGGIGILVKLDDVLSQVNDFNCLYYYLTKEVFSDFNFDDRAKNANRVNIISCDENLFINNDSLIEISNVDLSIYSEIHDDNREQKIITSAKPKKGIIQDLITTYTNNSYTTPFLSEYLLLHTHIDFDRDEIVKIEDVGNYIDCRVFYRIPDTYKRKTFTKIIIGLLELNGPNHLGAMFNYLKWVNDNRTTERMEYQKLVELFDSVKKDWIKGLFKFAGNRRYIHFNPSIKNLKTVKDKYRGELTGLARKLKTKASIDAAIGILEENNVKPTQDNVAKHLKISISTVKRYWKKIVVDRDDIREKADKINEDFRRNREQKYNTSYLHDGHELEELDYGIYEEIGEVFNSGGQDTQIQDETISEYKCQGLEKGDDNGARNTNHRTPLQHLKTGKVNAA